ncbi:MAG: hypothetical protein ACE5I7_04750 [Candidatus Binatia bacterium]
MGTVMGRLGLAVSCVVLAATPALAEPYIAVREGLRCSACHTNMNGGGKRTDLVNTHARDLLHYPSLLGKFSNPPAFLTGEINRFLAFGADLRTSETATFQELGKNGRVSNDKVFRDRLEKNDLDVTEAVVYGEVRLIPEYLTFYIDQRFQPQTDNREAFGLLRGILPWNGYIKAGRMFLPYGLQLQDDGAFIRGGTNGSVNTGFSFNQQQSGVEIGLEPGPLTLVAAVTNGPSGDRDVQVTATAYTMFTELPVVRNLLLGGSFSRVGPPGSETVLFGFFAGSNIERLTFLGEVDFRQDRTPVTNGRNVGRFIAYGEGDYLFFDWLNFKVAVDFSDDDGSLSSLADDSENRVSFGFEPFLNRFLQPRLFYRISNGVRSNPTHNQNVLMAEMHLFF